MVKTNLITFLSVLALSLFHKRIILLDVAHFGLLEQVVAVVHELTQALERLHHLGHVGDDGVFVLIGNLGQEVPFDGCIDGELHPIKVLE